MTIYRYAQEHLGTEVLVQLTDDQPDSVRVLVEQLRHGSTVYLGASEIDFEDPDWQLGLKEKFGEFHVYVLRAVTDSDR